MNYGHRKPDAAAINKFLEALPDTLGLKDVRRTWPRYLFHTAEIDNAVSILSTGVLYSRESAIQLQLQVKDTAHPGVISHTATLPQSCARFYFRPRTPTQYKTESFRPISQTEHPNYGIPVMLVFNAAEIATRIGTQFTDGNAGSVYHSQGDDVEFLRKIPFKSVYHEGRFSSEERNEIIHCRHAEALVPGGVQLDDTLEWIGLRSVAELDTLLCCLREENPHQYERYKGRARPDTLSSEAGPLFYREWTHFEEVWIADGKMKIRLSREKRIPAPSFKANFIVKSSDQTEVFAGKVADVTTAGTGIWTIALPEQCTKQSFIVEFRLDDRLAYRNRFPSLSEVVW